LPLNVADYVGANTTNLFNVHTEPSLKSTIKP